MIRPPSKPSFDRALVMALLLLTGSSCRWLSRYEDPALESAKIRFRVADEAAADGKLGEWDEHESWLGPAMLKWIGPNCFDLRTIHTGSAMQTVCTRHVVPGAPRLPDACAGTRSEFIDLLDADRGNRRVVGVWVHPPSPTSLAPSSMPVMIFAPGFGRDASDYSWIRNAKVLAFVVIGLPSDFAHARPTRDFPILADDILFLTVALPRLWRDESTALPPLFRRLFNGNVLVGGHSVGAGVALLSQSEVWSPAARLAQAPPIAFVGFGPSFLSAVPTVGKTHLQAARLSSVLFIVGEEDCIVPAVHDSGPALQLLPAARKAIVVLTGAIHSHWTGSGCKPLQPNPFFTVRECSQLERSEQRALGRQLVDGFQEAANNLTDADGAWKRFEDMLRSGEQQGHWRWQAVSPQRRTAPIKLPACPRPGCDGSALDLWRDVVKMGTCGTRTYYPGRFATERSGFALGACRGPFCRATNCSLDLNAPDEYPQVHRPPVFSTRSWTG